MTQMKNTQEELDRDDGASRRNLLAGAAWTAPAVVLTLAAPKAAASPPVETDLGTLSLDGTCGGLGGIVGPGFRLLADSVPLPVGTTINIVSNQALLGLDLFGFNSNLADLVVLSNTSWRIELTSELPAFASFTVSILVSLAIGRTMDATVSFPSGFVAPEGKTSAFVNQGLPIIGCTAG